MVLGAELLVAWREAPALDAALCPSSPELAHLQVHRVGTRCLYPLPGRLHRRRLLPDLVVVSFALGAMADGWAKAHHVRVRRRRLGRSLD